MKLELFACDSRPVASVYRTVHMFKSQYLSVWSVNVTVRKSHQNVLGAFANLRKATVSFVMSFCPSLRARGTTRLPLGGISRNLIFEYFSRKSAEKIKVELKCGLNKGYFT